jgi:hypothetical protein
MARHQPDPLASTERLLVDGTNLLHALARRPGVAPPAALVGRLRAIIPAQVAIDLVFDGPAESGMRGERIASGVHVRYGGARSADAVILSLVETTRRESGPEAVAAVLVVTDDRELRNGVTRRGGRTAGAGWLLGRLDSPRLAAPSIGRPRPAKTGTGPAVTDHRSNAPGAGDDPDDDHPGWRPGRGATTKRGNPRKAPRTGRTGRMPP